MKKYALIVGVSRYDDPEIGNLNFAADDAREMGACLREVCGFDEVRVLVSGGEREPDHISVVESLHGFAPVLNNDDLFLFYFAGHGIHTANGSFLLASNSRIRMPELAAVPMPLLQQCLSRLDASERVLILDACRNDPHQGRGDSDNLLTQEFSRDILAVAKAPCDGVVPATCVLFSCSEGERAYEWYDRKHGAFTWYLLDGLRGAARDTQGRVTVQALSRYVEEQVPRWSNKMAMPRKQTPWAQQLGSLRDICLLLQDPSEQGHGTPQDAGATRRENPPAPSSSASAPAMKADQTAEPRQKPSKRDQLVISQAVAALESEDWEDRKASVEKLTQMGAAAGQHLHQIAALLTDDDEDVRKAAAEAVLKFGYDESCADPVREALSSDDWEIRLAAVHLIQAAAKRNQPTSTLAPALANLVSDDDGDVRSAAMAALESVGFSNDCLPGFAAAIESEDWEVRQCAIKELAKLAPDNDRALEIIAPCLFDEDDDVRAAAMQVLESCDD